MLHRHGLASHHNASLGLGILLDRLFIMLGMFTKYRSCYEQLGKFWSSRPWCGKVFLSPRIFLERNLACASSPNIAFCGLKTEVPIRTVFFASEVTPFSLCCINIEILKSLNWKLHKCINFLPKYTWKEISRGGERWGGPRKMNIITFMHSLSKVMTFKVAKLIF